MGFLRDFRAKLLNSYISEPEIEELIYKMSNYFIRYIPYFEAIYVKNAATKYGTPKIGNLVWDSENEVCLENVQSFIDDLAIFFNTVRLEGGEILIVAIDDKEAKHGRVFGYLQSPNSNFIDSCSVEVLENNMNGIKENYKIPVDYILEPREVPISLFIEEI